ncbi:MULTISPECIES: hypothetical protein [unclassified Paenarthrobacter]|uniref:hypothetical protein n=1 Tax=unclassified Paenarthrobacter TaxID=2634190 RepID=UPI003CECE125
MTVLAERPVTTHSATETAAVTPALRKGSYVTLPAGTSQVRSEGSYVTVPGNRNIPPVIPASYVKVAGAPAVTAGPVGGNYVTLSTAA